MQSQANGNAGAEKKEEEGEGGEGGIKIKNQSVLQAKLTKLAIQIGYAGLHSCFFAFRPFSQASEAVKQG